MKIIDTVLQHTSTLLLFINALLFTYCYFKRNKSKAVKYLAIYLTLSFCFSILSQLIIHFHEQLNIAKNNLFLTHFYFSCQYLFLTLFYSEFFNKKQRNYQKIISFAIFSIIVIQYLFNPSSFYEFNLLEIFITSFPLVIYSLFHLYNSLSKPGKFMYINAGVLIYLSISSLVFILGNLLNTVDRSLSISIWFVNRAFYFGYLLLFLIEWKKNLWKTTN